MDLTGGRRASLLAYCRIEAEDLTAEEDGLLEVLYWSAVGYMAQAGVAEPGEGSPRRAQYDLCVNALVLDGWDRRGTAVQERGTYTTVENRSFRQLLNQLKRTEPAAPERGSTEAAPCKEVRVAAPDVSMQGGGSVPRRRGTGGGHVCQRRGAEQAD